VYILNIFGNFLIKIAEDLSIKLESDCNILNNLNKENIIAIK